MNSTQQATQHCKPATTASRAQQLGEQFHNDDVTTVIKPVCHVSTGQDNIMVLLYLLKSLWQNSRPMTPKLKEWLMVC